jgi:hypothetical protein
LLSGIVILRRRQTRQSQAKQKAAQKSSHLATSRHIR